ncbi:reverse transcriptase domain-containing protein [Tanacetum coccineum]
MPPPFINLEEDERVEETLTDPDLTEFTIKEICTPVGIARDVFVPVRKFTFPADFLIVDYESDPRVPLILGRPFLRSARALIDVHGEEMILHDGDESLILNMRNDTSRYSNTPKKESINMIDIYNISHEEYLEDLLANEKNYQSSKWQSHFLSHFSYRLNFTGSYQSIEWQFHSDFRTRDEVFFFPHNYFLRRKFVETISRCFTDEHALDYSSPPLWDDYDDELFDLETVNDNTYDDPFYSKKRKIKCDLVFYEDFSEADALPSTNNEDKDFNPPLYELPFQKEVLGSETLLSFSSENEEKVFNPRILTSKGVHTSLLLELSHRGSKAFKVIKIFESPMEIFPCSYGEDIRDCPDFEASHARGFVLRSQEL